MRVVHRFAVAVFCLWLLCQQSVAQAASAPFADPRAGLEDILQYIDKTWTTLTRSLDSCETLIDPKLPQQSVLYLPAEMSIPASIRALGAKCNVGVENLPVRIETLSRKNLDAVKRPGLLYLEHPYVVPGGRFNEMYGWDSYFIILGLLRDGKTDLARGIVDNFLFEIEHYGVVLNANRTYYLTRSQPPFLTSMVLAIFDIEKAQTAESRAWLSRAYADANKEYEYWTREPHLIAGTGLSRYYDFGEGPVPEERATYAEVMQAFLLHVDTKYLEPKSPLHPDWPGLTLFACEGASAAPSTNCKRMQTVGLKSEYYKGDRSMRESGFDISFRFGPYGADTHRYVPVCLNSLLYKTETDMERIATVLGREPDAKQWHERAQARRELMHKYLWDEQRGMFFDYNFETQKRSNYEYATTFYPLWAGVATPEQARGVVRNLPTFERAGGLVTSPYETGVQWDYPYGWAPIQLLATEGLRRYGFDAQADRISVEWLSTIVENFRREGTLREKYNVITQSSEAPISAGYRSNVVGFGWTNGVFLEMLQQLPEEWVHRVAQPRQAPAAVHP